MFATGTGTRRNLREMRKAGIGVLLTPDRPELPPDFTLYAIDNGAWGAHQRGEAWDSAGWLPLLARHSAAAQWCVLPDIVEGGAESLAFSLRWLEKLQGVPATWLLAVQDGMSVGDVAPHVGPHCGIFVGGSTEWKEASLPTWGRLARQAGCWLHVGRVNTARRIRLCAMADADSCDGTSATRFATNAPKIGRWMKQRAFAFDAMEV